MPIYILCREWGEWLVVHNYNVRARARLYNAQLMGEILGGNLSVVCEKHCCNFVPSNVWHGGVVPLYGQGDLKAFQHIERICVGAESYQYALFKQLQHRRAAHGVAHVRFGVVNNHCAGFAYYVHFRGAYVYAVPKQRPFAQNAVVQQAVHAAAAVVLHGIVNVVHAFANVNMEARAPAVCLNAFFKRLIAYREQRMPAEHGLQHGVVFALAVIYKALVLLNGFIALLFAVALAHLIA